MGDGDGQYAHSGPDDNRPGPLVDDNACRHIGLDGKVLDAGDEFGDIAAVGRNLKLHRCRDSSRLAEPQSAVMLSAALGGESG